MYIFIFFIHISYGSSEELLHTRFKKITNNALQDLYYSYNFKEKDPEEEKQKQFISNSFCNIFENQYNNFKHKNEIQQIILSNNEEDITSLTQIMKKKIYCDYNYEKLNESPIENIDYFNKNIVENFLKDIYNYSILKENQNSILENFSPSQKIIKQSLNLFKNDIQDRNFQIQNDLCNYIKIDSIDENTKKTMLPAIIALHNNQNLKEQFFLYLILHSSNSDSCKIYEKEQKKLNIFDFINQSKDREIFIQKAIISLLVNNQNISQKMKKNLIKTAFGYNSLIKNNPKNNPWNKKNISASELSTLRHKYKLPKNDFNTLSTIQIFSDFEGLLHHYSKENLKNKWYATSIPSDNVSQIILQIESEFKDKGSEIIVPDYIKKLFSLHNTLIQNKNKFLNDPTYFNNEKKGIVDILFENSYLNLDHKACKNNHIEFALLKNNLKLSKNKLNSYLIVCLNEFNRSRSPVKDVIFKDIKNYQNAHNSTLQKFQTFVFNEELKKYHIGNYDKNLFLKIPKQNTENNHIKKEYRNNLENLSTEKNFTFIPLHDYYCKYTQQEEDYTLWLQKIKNNHHNELYFKIKNSFNKLLISDNFKEKDENNEYFALKDGEALIQLNLDTNPVSMNEECIFKMIIENVNNSYQLKKSYNSVVLIGPSGTGKTFSAENAPYLEYWYRLHKDTTNKKNTYIAFSPNQIQGKYFSETEKNAQKLFDDIIKKIKNGESITLFIDECNPLFSKRSNGENSDSVHNNVFDQVKNSFLAFMQDLASGKDDLYDQGGSLLLMAACNSTKDFEPALYGIGGRIKYVLEFLNLPHIVAPQYLEKIYSNTELFSYQDAPFKNKLDVTVQEFFDYFKITPHRGIDNVIEKVNTKINQDFYGIGFTDIEKYNEFENLIIYLIDSKKEIDSFINNINKNIEQKENLFNIQETFVILDKLSQSVKEIKKYEQESKNNQNAKLIMNEKIKQFNSYFMQFRLKASNDLIKLHMLLKKNNNKNNLIEYFRRFFIQKPSNNNIENKTITNVIAHLEKYIKTIETRNEKILTQIKVEFETIKNEYFKEKNYNAKQEEMTFQNLLKMLHRDASDNLLKGFKKSTDTGQRIQLLQNPLFYVGNWSDRIINRANIPLAVGIGGVVGYTKLFNPQPWENVFNTTINTLGMHPSFEYQNKQQPTAEDYIKILLPIGVGIISTWLLHNIQNETEDTKIIDKGYELEKNDKKKPSQIYYRPRLLTRKLNFNFNKLIEKERIQKIIDNAIHNNSSIQVAPAA